MATAKRRPTAIPTTSTTLLRTVRSPQQPADRRKRADTREQRVGDARREPDDRQPYRGESHHRDGADGADGGPGETSVG